MNTRPAIQMVSPPDLIRTKPHPLTLIASAALAAALLTVTFNAVRVFTHATFSDVILLATGVLLIVAWLAGALKPVRPPVWFIASCSTFIAGGVISSALSVATAASLAGTAELAAAAFVAPLIIGAASRSPRRIMRFADLWLVSAGLNCLVALLDFLGVTTIGRSVLGREFLHRMAGLTSHPNHLGLVAGMALPIAVAQLARASGQRRRIQYGLLASATVIGLLVAGSRAAFGGAAAGLLFLLIVAGPDRRRVAPYVGGLIGIGLIFVGVALATHTGFITLQRITGVDTGQNTDTRLTYYREALSGFASSPFLGHGFQLIVQAHDIYLQLLQSGGLLALGAFSAYLIGALRSAWRLGHDPELPAALRPLVAGLAASILVWLVNGLAGNQLYDRYLYVPFGLLLGLSFLSLKQNEAQS